MQFHQELRMYDIYYFTQKILFIFEQKKKSRNIASFILFLLKIWIIFQFYYLL